MSREITFDNDIEDPSLVRSILAELVADVGHACEVMASLPGPSPSSSLSRVYDHHPSEDRRHPISR